MSVAFAPVRIAAVRRVRSPSRTQWLGRCGTGIVDALRATFIYGEARRLCTPPADEPRSAARG